MRLLKGRLKDLLQFGIESGYDITANDGYGDCYPGGHGYGYGFGYGHSHISGGGNGCKPNIFTNFRHSKYDWTFAGAEIEQEK